MLTTVWFSIPPFNNECFTGDPLGKSQGEIAEDERKRNWEGREIGEEEENSKWEGASQ